MTAPSAKVRARVARIKLFLCDVDGVLTDGSVLMGRNIELKRFDIRDGLGLKFLQGQGIRVGWISRRRSRATQARAKDLKIDFVMEIEGSKVAAAEIILRRTGLSWADVCYVGDDIVDLNVLKRAGFAVAVADGVAEVRRAAHYVTRAPGGRGAIRETVELILKAQGKWQKVVSEHAG